MSDLPARGRLCDMGSPLEKIIGGVTPIVSYRLTWDGCGSLLPFGGVLSFRSSTAGTGQGGAARSSSFSVGGRVRGHRPRRGTHTTGMRVMVGWLVVNNQFYHL